MKNKEVIQALHALQRLDGYPSEKGVMIPYHLGSDASYAIVKNLKKAMAIQEDLDAARVRMLKALLKPGEKELKQDDPRFVGFSEELNALYEQESDFKPHLIKLKSLKLDQNPIPPTVLAVLDSLIADEESPSSHNPSTSGV